MNSIKLSLFFICVGVLLGIIGVEAFPPMHDTIHNFQWYDAIALVSLALMIFGAINAFRLATTNPDHSATS